MIIVGTLVFIVFCLVLAQLIIHPRTTGVVENYSGFSKAAKKESFGAIAYTEQEPVLHTIKRELSKICENDKGYKRAAQVARERLAAAKRDLAENRGLVCVRVINIVSDGYEEKVSEAVSKYRRMRAPNH